MSEEYNLLALDENPTLADIQISFAYFYQMIDLIYPLDKNGSTGKERFDEFKKLEKAYLFALKGIRNEIIANSNHVDANITNPLINELNKIEDLLTHDNHASIQYNLSNSNLNYDANSRTSCSPHLLKNDKNTLLYTYGNFHKIKFISENEITIKCFSSTFSTQIIKGELLFPGGQKFLIVGKIISGEKDKTIVKLVTRIPKKWICKHRTKNLNSDN